MFLPSQLSTPKYNRNCGFDKGLMTTAADIVHLYRKYYAGKYLSRVLQ
jgi:hypothetical protein